MLEEQLHLVRVRVRVRVRARVRVRVRARVRVRVRVRVWVRVWRLTLTLTLTRCTHHRGVLVHTLLRPDPRRDLAQVRLVVRGMIVLRSAVSAA